MLPSMRIRLDAAIDVRTHNVRVAICREWPNVRRRFVCASDAHEEHGSTPIMWLWWSGVGESGWAHIVRRRVLAGGANGKTFRNSLMCTAGTLHFCLNHLTHRPQRTVCFECPFCSKGSAHGHGRADALSGEMEKRLPQLREMTHQGHGRSRELGLIRDVCAAAARTGWPRCSSTTQHG